MSTTQRAYEYNWSRVTYALFPLFAQGSRAFTLYSPVRKVEIAVYFDVGYTNRSHIQMWKSGAGTPGLGWHF